MEARLVPGALLGPYVIERTLGRGGMGQVFVASHSETGERVALKVVGATTAANALRFDRESRLADRLDHPHIVAGRGHGRTAEGLAWLAMELLVGEDLEARLARAPLTVTETITLAMQMCDALGYAHGLGVVHRDLKPSNIFLLEGPTLRARLVDFGIARVADESRLTGTDATIGTPAYMSPEQARGERDVDARSDLWSLGVVLYECLSGRRPFVAESYVATLFRIIETAPQRLDEFSCDVSVALADVVHHTLEKHRSRRPQNAAAVRAALLDLAPETLVPSVARPSMLPPEPASPTDWGAADESAEHRLASVALLRGVRDMVLVEAVARELRGRIERLAGGGVLVLFGLDRWTGDEPSRALRFGLAAVRNATAVAISTGRILRGAMQVVGAAINTTARLIARDGLTLDAATAAAVRDEVLTHPEPDGAFSVEPATRTRESLSPPAYDTPFVGREVELAALLRAVDEAAELRRPTGVTVVAAAGFGKSRLRHEALERAVKRTQGVTCVSVRGDGSLRATPFGALRQAFSDALGEAVGGVFGAGTERLDDATAALDRVRASLAGVLAGLAESGVVVLALDDAQWLDTASLAMIRWLRETQEDLSLAVWVFARPEIAGAASLVGGAPMELGPLDAAAATQLLESLAGEAPPAVIERAGGHPLFLEELGRRLSESAGDPSAVLTLPVSVESAYLEQIDLMALDEREFLKRAAVFGRVFWSEGVGALGGDAKAATRLRETRLLVPVARSRITGAKELRFRSAVLHEVVYQLLPDGARARLHGLAAQWMAAREGASASELARHWELAGERAKAAAAWVRATEEAASVADTESACLHAARALALTDDVALRWQTLVARDNALQLTDRLSLAREGLDALDALARQLEARQQVEAAWRRCYFERMTGGVEAAFTAGRAGIARAESLGDLRWRASLHIDLALLEADAGAIDEARAHAATAGALAATIDDPWLQARAAAAAAYVLQLAGELTEAMLRLDVAATGFARAGDRRREALLRVNAGWTMMRLGRVAEAMRETEAAIASSRRVGNDLTTTSGTHNLGVLRRIVGDLAGAEALQTQAEAINTKRSNPRFASAIATERVYLALARGDRREASVLGVKARALGDATRSPTLVAPARAVALRAAAGFEGASPDDVAEARARAASHDSAECRAELLVAVWEADGRRDEDRLAARAALDAVVARVGVEADRAACRAVLQTRYAVPAALLV